MEKLSHFFIERPVFANVIAIMTMIAGAVALWGLPVEQFPSITPPTVVVLTSYPGANAEVLSDAVGALIEQEINGVEGMIYMSSSCSNDGSYRLTVTFEIGTDLDKAQVLVQNRLAAALPRLPQEVQRLGVLAQKQSTSFLLAVALTSRDGRYDELFLGNYATLRIKNTLSRIPGVGGCDVFGGSRYGMRIWINPERLKARDLSTEDVLAAIREQNVQVAAGQVGQSPVPETQAFQYNVTTPGRLRDADQFGDIIVKVDDSDVRAPRLTRLRDVARIELGAEGYDQWIEIGGQSSAGLGINLLPGANALDVARRVKEAMDLLRRSFPEGVDYSIPYDTTPFVEESIHEVYKTLIEAGVLVLVVILLFLQDWRAVLIPATTVPVTIIGTFAAMAAMGFSVNMLTLFGLVLAVGIVVDDAIVIVENAVHHIDREQRSPKDATIHAMSEVTGPIIGITLVLMAVFLPTAFLGGIIGQLYRQFALTIAATALISAINAVTLKPAQCALYLRPTASRRSIVFRAFNVIYDRCEKAYGAAISHAVRHVAWMILFFIGLSVLTGWWFIRLPTGFLPSEDKGYAIVGIQLPDAASQTRTRAVVKKVSAILKNVPGVESWFMIGGMSLLDGAVASNAATMFITFTPWSERTGRPGLSQEEILAEVNTRSAQVREASISVYPPPAIDGLGVAGGFEMQIEDRGGMELTELQKIIDEMVRAGESQTGLTRLQSSFRAGVPMIHAEVDRVKAKSLGVALDTIFGTLQTALGSSYVNDFNKFGRTWQVRVQADQRFRLEPEDIKKLEVRDRQGNMIPLGTIVTIEKKLGPRVVPRYNLYPSAAIIGMASPGSSSGQALELMEQMADRTLPPTAGYEWTGMSYQEKRVGSQAIFVFAMAVLMVYLVLAAQYESWTMPAAVILVVPLALLGTVAAVAVRGMDNNVYTQIGIVLIIALASKNAILIVEFAQTLRRKGRSILDAAVEASRLRFRPIVMTSFAFILGILPLVNATGAGAASRRALGTAVFGGMIASTVLAVFFVPVFFVVLQRLSEYRWSRSSRDPSVLAVAQTNGVPVN